MNDPQEDKHMNGLNNITIGWVIGGAILVLLLGFSVYTGHGTPPSERTPNAVTRSQQK